MSKALTIGAVFLFLVIIVKPLGSISRLKCVGRINRANLCGQWCFQHLGRTERREPALTQSPPTRPPRYIRLS